MSNKIRYCHSRKRYYFSCDKNIFVRPTRQTYYCHGRSDNSCHVIKYVGIEHVEKVKNIACFTRLRNFAQMYTVFGECFCRMNGCKKFYESEMNLFWESLNLFSDFLRVTEKTCRATTEIHSSIRWKSECYSIWLDTMRKKYEVVVV